MDDDDDDETIERRWILVDLDAEGCTVIDDGMIEIIFDPEQWDNVVERVDDMRLDRLATRKERMS